MTDEEFARDIVKKIVQAERLGGGFRLFRDDAISQIIKRLVEARGQRAPTAEGRQ